jgi:hypothetical protein
MIKGILTANLDPPCLEFFSNDTKFLRKNCSAEDLRTMMIALDVICPNERWQPNEFVFRINGEFPKKSLEALGLLPS